MTTPAATGYLRRIILSISCLVFAFGAIAAESTKVQFNIPADKAEVALKQLSQQSGVEVLFPTDAVAGIKTNAVRGEMTPREALDQMVAGTGLVAIEGKNSSSLSVKRDVVPNAQRAIAKSDRPESQTKSDEEKTTQLPVFEVMGSKLLNMDIKRSIDDPQPYVVFDRASIEQSGATSINEFLKNRLTQNTVSTTNAQQMNVNGSSINLRGLGPDQTLILIDGRRAPNYMYAASNAVQPDLNGIPVSAIERIEVLPTTASGIYGGSATGGVVNVILRRDYAGAEVKITYGNTFDTDVSLRKVDFSSGVTIEGGKTNILLAGSHSQQDILALSDRSFPQANRYTLLSNSGNNYQTLNSGSTPPLGATTNLRSSTGVNLTLKTGELLNSPITYVPVGYSGTVSDGGRSLLANAGRYNLQLANTAAYNGSFTLAGAKVPLLTASETKSLMLTVRRQFTKNIQLFGDLYGSESESSAPFSRVLSGTLAANAPNNPFVQAVTFNTPLAAPAYNRATMYNVRASVGAILKVRGGWTVETDYLWNRAYVDFRSVYLPPTALTTALGNGTLDIMRDLTAYPVDISPYGAFPTRHPDKPPRTTLEDATLRVGGPFNWIQNSAGSVSASVEHRRQGISEGLDTLPNLTVLQPSRSQSVDSGYIEVNLPLIAARSQRFPGQELDLQMSTRADSYTTNGVTGTIINPFTTATVPIVRAVNKVKSVDPTVALRYQPIRDITLRMSYGTGFLPPTTDQVTSDFIPTASSTIVVDPRRGNTMASLSPIANQYISGGNPNLKPEHSKNLSAGVILTPRVLAGLRISVDYVKVSKRDNIATFPGGAQGIVNNESLFPDRVQRGPKTATDPVDWAGPISFLNATLMNLAKTKMEAYDVRIDYEKRTEVGTISAFALGTRETHYKTQGQAGSPSIENVGYTNLSPLGFRANAGLTWTFERFTFGWNGRYFGSYMPYTATDASATIALRILNQGNARIPSQHYHDIFVTYRFKKVASPGKLHRLMNGSEVTMGVKNLFNREPPFVANEAFLYSGFGDPRLANYLISIKNAF